jgi:preprotein translocase subunit YajC
MNFILFDVDNNPIINGSQKVVTQTQRSSGNATANASTSTGGFSTLLIYVALFFVLYWFFIRPAKKQQQRVFDFQSQLKAGDDIVTSSGMHGKIIDVLDKTVLVEFGLNKSVRVHMDKSQIMRYDNANNNETIIDKKSNEDV